MHFLTSRDDVFVLILLVYGFDSSILMKVMLWHGFGILIFMVLVGLYTFGVYNRGSYERGCSGEPLGGGKGSCDVVLACLAEKDRLTPECGCRIRNYVRW